MHSLVPSPLFYVFICGGGKKTVWGRDYPVQSLSQNNVIKLHVIFGVGIGSCDEGLLCVNELVARLVEVARKCFFPIVCVHCYSRSS